MSYDQYQVERIDRTLKDHNVNYFQKKMFGGLVFMVEEKMCIGTHIDKRSSESLLMIRIGQEAYDANKERPGCKPMDYTGRPMKDYAFITAEGYDTEDDLIYWIELALAFNPLAKAGKKRKKKVD